MGANHPHMDALGSALCLMDSYFSAQICTLLFWGTQAHDGTLQTLHFFCLSKIIIIIITIGFSHLRSHQGYLKKWTARNSSIRFRSQLSTDEKENQLVPTVQCLLSMLKLHPNSGQRTWSRARESPEWKVCLELRAWSPTRLKIWEQLVGPIVTSMVWSEPMDQNLCIHLQPYLSTDTRLGVEMSQIRSHQAKWVPFISSTWTQVIC